MNLQYWNQNGKIFPLWDFNGKTFLFSFCIKRSVSKRVRIKKNKKKIGSKKWCNCSEIRKHSYGLTWTPPWAFYCVKIRPNKYRLQALCVNNHAYLINLSFSRFWWSQWQMNALAPWRVLLKYYCSVSIIEYHKTEGTHSSQVP